MAIIIPNAAHRRAFESQVYPGGSSLLSALALLEAVKQRLLAGLREELVKIGAKVVCRNAAIWLPSTPAECYRSR